MQPQNGGQPFPVRLITAGGIEIAVDVLPEHDVGLLDMLPGLRMPEQVFDMIGLLAVASAGIGHLGGRTAQHRRDLVPDLRSHRLPRRPRIERRRVVKSTDSSLGGVVDQAAGATPSLPVVGIEQSLGERVIAAPELQIAPIDETLDDGGGCLVAVSAPQYSQAVLVAQKLVDALRREIRFPPSPTRFRRRRYKRYSAGTGVARSTPQVRGDRPATGPSRPTKKRQRGWNQSGKERVMFSIPSPKCCSE